MAPWPDLGSFITFRAKNWVHTLRSESEKQPGHRMMTVYVTPAPHSMRSLALPEGGMVEDVETFFSIIRGEPSPRDDQKLEGVGIMAYSKAIDGADFHSDRTVHGWFWLPDAIFDEVWRLSSLEAPASCHLGFHFETLEMQGQTYVWDAHKIKLIARTVDLSFQREEKEKKAAQQPQKRGLFERLTR